MTVLGDVLKNAREKNGLSLEEIESFTKIQMRYLQAVEEGEYEKLPGLFYARAFIKSYAEAVGLDGQKLLAEYSEEIPGVDQNMQGRLISRSQRTRARSAGRGSSKWSSLLPRILATIAVIGVFVVIWVVLLQVIHYGPEAGKGNHTDPSASISKNSDLSHENQQPGQDSNTAGNSSTNEPSGPSKSNQEDEQNQKAEQQIVKTGDQGGTAYYTLKNADTFQLGLSMTIGRSWIEIRKDNALGEKYKYETIPKGEIVTLDLSKEKDIYVQIGNTSHVKMEINGESFTYPSDDTVQSFIFHYEKPEKIS